MITNIIILSTVLITNSQQAIVGEHQGKAVLAAQETVIQRTITLEDVVLRSTVSTNLVGFAFPKAAVQTGTNGVELQAPAKSSPPVMLNTNLPAYKRRLEREQRLKPSTNAPPLEDDPRK